MSTVASAFSIEDLNPDDYEDGVFYVPERIELQPKQLGWGHSDRPGLRERVAEDRPHGKGGQRLLCLLCMRGSKPNPDGTREPVWMTFVETRYGPVFRHEKGHRAPHEEHMPESDTHKVLKEREAGTWELAGATVRVEEWRPGARRRPDVFAERGGFSVAGEVQHSVISAREVGRRQKALATSGDRVVWTTDRNADEMDFLRRVPHLAVPALDDYRLYRREQTRELNVVSGWTFFESQKCGWTDLWLGSTTRCPVSRKQATCGKFHLYPTLQVGEYRPDADAQFPLGKTMHLDHLLEGILNEAWLPYRPTETRTTWIPAAWYDDVVEERGSWGDPEKPLRPRVSRVDPRRACERGAMMPTQRQPVVAEEVMLLRPEPMCCGLKFPELAGRPLDRQCTMCSRSPSFWRLKPLQSGAGLE
jgi:hypothetical protein